MYKSKFNLFTSGDLGSALEAKLAELRREIENQSDDYLLGADGADLVAYFTDKYDLEPLALHVDQVTMDATEVDVRAEDFPSAFYVRSGSTYRKPGFAFYLPFDGDSTLLKHKPSTYIMWSTEVWIEDGCVCFEVVSLNEDGAEARRRKDEIITNITKQVANINKEIASYRENLESHVRTALRQRREKIQKKLDMIGQIDVPLRKRNDAPNTFSVPSPKKRRMPVERPPARQKQVAPTPALADAAYDEVLETIHGTGKMIERLPATHENRNEEGLRDILLVPLQALYEASATGETFNKGGKTDILLRYENSNVFVAECAMWNGAKYLASKIDQLLGNLTWRDSKAAVILFVRNKEFSDVLSKIRDAVPEHPCFVSESGVRDETWRSYSFHLPGEEGRKIRLAILAFHLPE